MSTVSKNYQRGIYDTWVWIISANILSLSEFLL